MQTSSIKGARLSLQQERLWTIQQGSRAYRVCGAIWMDGELDVTVLQRTLKQIIEQHEILRTVFTLLPGADTPVQVIGRHVAFSCPLIDLEYLPFDEHASAIERQFAFFQGEEFDFAHGPLFRVCLLRLSATRHLLLPAIAALCADGATLPVLLADICRRYNAELQGHSYSVAEEPLQQTDVSSWQNELLREDMSAPRDFWRRMDLLQRTQVALPFEPENNRQRSLSTNFMPAVRIIQSGEEWNERIHGLARRYGIPVSSFLLGCWHLLHWKLSGGSEPLIGVGCNGRVDEELEDLPGPYTRFVPVSIYSESTWSVQQVMRAMHEAMEEVTRWQAYFTWSMQEDAEASRNESSPFFAVTFWHDQWPEKMVAAQVTCTLSRCSSYVEPFVLNLTVRQIGRDIQLELHYDTQAVMDRQVVQLIAAFRALLEDVLEERVSSVAALRTVSAAGQRRLYEAFSAPEEPLQALALHQIFEKQVEAGPKRLAVLDATLQWTYMELNRRANQLAHYLRRRGVGPGILVGLYVHRSVEMIMGILAIFKAGGGYVPLDPESPPGRILFQLQDAKVGLLLSQQALLAHVEGWGGHILSLESLLTEVEQEAEENLHLPGCVDDPAYVIYTSGSTGRPKGVMIRQGSVVNYTLGLCRRLGITGNWHFATVSTLAADLGNSAIFAALTSGGCLQVLDYATITSTAVLLRWVEQYPIDVLKIVPSHLSALLSTEEAGQILPARALILGGEALPVALVQRVRQLAAQAGKACRIYNHYGPTETTIGVLMHELSSEEEETGRVPLGRPLPGSAVYVLDRGGQFVPAGVKGEIVIGGRGVAVGYVGLAQETATRFVPHPYGDEGGARLYRSGDIGRYDEEGLIEYVGRGDQQVKIRGYRIEPGEIEVALLRHPGIRNTAVVVREDRPGQPQLVAYITLRQQPEPSLDELQAFLQDQLPAYMLPSAVVSMRVLPLTANGKLDRNALPVPVAEHEASMAYVPPRSPLEEILVGIWEEILNAQTISVHSNFFHLGGHSLLVTQVISRVRNTFHVELPVRSLFDAPTIAELARQIEPMLIGSDGRLLPAPVPVPRAEEVPLSFAQQRLWFLDRLAPGDITYNVAHALHIRGTFDVSAMSRALHEVVRRHENLRTIFPLVDGRPLQIIRSVTSFTLQFCDLSALAEEEARSQSYMLVAQHAQISFDLAQGPLLRVMLLRLNDRHHTLLLAMHHIISDAWSRNVLIRELNTLYAAFTQNVAHNLPELPIQYADFAVWQRNWLQGDVLKGLVDYWVKQLEGAVPLELLTDRPRPLLQQTHGATDTIFLPSALASALVALSHQEDITLFMLLLGAFQVLLARYSAQEDILVGTPVANRNHAEIENLIGFFTNTLVMRTNLSGNPTFHEVFERVRAVALGAYAHQDLPFEHLVEVLQPVRDLSRSPLFQVMFVLQHAHHAASDTLKLGGTSLQGVSQSQTTAKFDLTLFVTSTPHGLSCTMEYSTDLFEAATIARLLAHWRLLLETLVDHPDYRIGSFPLLTGAEQQTIVREWNDTSCDMDQTGGIHTLFEAQAGLFPDCIAAVEADHFLSYACLNQVSNQLARHLQSCGVGSDVVVGFYLERSLMMMVALLGILKAGGAFLPLDPAYPEERLRYMLHDARAAFLLTVEHMSERLQPQPGYVLMLDMLWPLIRKEAGSNVSASVHPDHLAYIIYTSGSTGQPKGVAMPHRPLSNLFQWHLQCSQAGRGTRTLQFSSASFDLAYHELFSTWAAGGTLYLIAEELHKDAFQLAKFIQSAALERIFLPFVALQQLAFVFDRSEILPYRISEVITAGEQLQITAALQRFFSHLGSATLSNQYGPSESHVVTAFMLNGSAEHWPLLPPIGVPVSNTQIYLLNEQFQPVAIGAIGELCISGDSLARGYLYRPESTAERFMPDPWSTMPGARLYRTGDIACYRPDGTIQFLGRRDHQVKIRGHRVELGEIEVALSQYPSVSECVVALREDTYDEKRLVAYVVAHEETRLNAKEMRVFLEGKLPDAMIPAHFVALPSLPLTSSGKIDRRALPVIDLSDEQFDYARPRDALEAQLLLIWREVLGRENIGIANSFFDLGGHSILAVRLVSRIQEVLGRDVALSMLFQFPTVAECARALREDVDSHDESVLVPIQPMGTQRPPFFCVHPVGGTVFRYYMLADFLGKEQPFYGLQTPDLDGRGELHSTVEELAAQYIAAIQSVQPDGPYFLGGWSMGGVVAFEMAQQLQRQGHRIALLALLDSVLVNFPDKPPRTVEALDTSDEALARAFIDYYNLSLPEMDGDGFSTDQRLRAVIEQLKHIGILTEGINFEQARRIMRVNLSNLHAFQTYQPEICSYPLTLFRAEEGINDTPSTQGGEVPRGRTRSRGWDGLTTTGLEICLVPGNHSNMLDEPQVQVLAVRLRHSIDKVLES